MYNKQIAEVFASLRNRLLSDRINSGFKQLDSNNHVLQYSINEKIGPSVNNIENIR